MKDPKYIEMRDKLQTMCNDDGSWNTANDPAAHRCARCCVKFMTKEALDEHKRGARHRDGRESPSSVDGDEGDDAVSDQGTSVGDPHSDSDGWLSGPDADKEVERCFSSATLAPRRRLWDAGPARPLAAGGGVARPAARASDRPSRNAGKPAAKRASRSSHRAAGSDSDDGGGGGAVARHRSHDSRGRKLGPDGEPEDVPGLESSSGSEDGSGEGAE